MSLPSGRNPILRRKIARSATKIHEISWLWEQFGGTTGSGIQRGFRDLGRGSAAEFASHPMLDYPALTTHLIIDIIALGYMWANARVRKGKAHARWRKGAEPRSFPDRLGAPETRGCADRGYRRGIAPPRRLAGRVAGAVFVGISSARED
jgi:hypothetical protein